MTKIAWGALAALICLQVPAVQAQNQACRPGPRSSTQGQGVALLAAPDGAFWYASPNTNRILRMDAKGQETPFVPVDGSTSGLSGLAFDGKGNVWFSKNTPGLVGRFPMAGGAGVEFKLPERHSFPVGIIHGPDGAMWYRDTVQKNIGRVAPDGSVTLIPAPPKTNPFIPNGMAFADANTLWITDQGENALWKLDIRSQSYQRFDIPDPRAHPGAVRVAKDGSVWLIMTAVRKVARFQNGVFTTTALGEESPRGLHIAEDQSVWFGSSHGFLHRLRPDGEHEKYRCPNLSGPLTTSTDGTVWALSSSGLLTLKPGSDTHAPVVAARNPVQGPAMMPLGASPVKQVTLAELRKLFDDKEPKLVVHYTVPAGGGCGPCDDSLKAFEEFARKNVGRARFVRLANEYSEAAWSDPWYARHAALAGLPTYITYYDQKEVARVGGHEPAAVLDARLLPAR